MTISYIFLKRLKDVNSPSNAIQSKVQSSQIGNFMQWQSFRWLDIWCPLHEISYLTILWTFVTWLDGPKSPNSFVFRCSNATNPMIWNRHLSKTLIASHSYRKHPVFPPPLLFLSSLNCQRASQIIIQPTIKRTEQTWIRYGILRTLPAAILCHHFLCTPCSH